MTTKTTSEFPSIARCTLDQLEQSHKETFSAALKLLPGNSLLIRMDLITMELIRRLEEMTDV